MAQIHDAMAAILAEVTPIAKEKQNTEQRYKFRGIDQVAEMIHPLLAKHGVVALPRVVEQARDTYQSRNGSQMHWVALTIDWHFVARDASEVIVTTVGEASDSADKATNKAMTASQKYAFTLAFTIPWSDQADGDYDHPERNGVAPVQRPQTPPPTPLRQPAAARSPVGAAPVGETEAKALLAYTIDASKKVGIHGLELTNRALQWMGMETVPPRSKYDAYLRQVARVVSSSTEYREAVNAVMREMTEPAPTDADAPL
jgi:hypothetical protein